MQAWRCCGDVVVIDVVILDAVALAHRGCAGEAPGHPPLPPPPHPAIPLRTLALLHTALLILLIRLLCLDFHLPVSFLILLFHRFSVLLSILLLHLPTVFLLLTVFLLTIFFLPIFLVLPLPPPEHPGRGVGELVIHRELLSLADLHQDPHRRPGGL